MPNLEFSAPYNSDPETLKEIFRLKKFGGNRIREVYLSGPQEYSGSGRIMFGMDITDFTNIVDMIHSEGIRVNLILNPTCEGSDWYSPEVMRRKLEFLRQMREKHGLEEVTISNPIYIKEVRKQFPNMDICASVLGDIDCVQKAVLYSKMGANVITPDVNINRDLKLLKEIKENANVEIKLMLNEGCIYKCPLRKFHFNYISHKSIDMDYVEGDWIFNSNCVSIMYEDPSQVLKSCWIRPEDTSKYSEITNFFKIVDRSSPISWIIRATKAYLGESWGGNLLDILDSSANFFGLKYGVYIDNKSLDAYKFFEKVASCAHSCGQCGYCGELAGKLMTFGVPTLEN